MSRRLDKARHFYGAGKTLLSPFPRDCRMQPGHWQDLPDWGPGPRCQRVGKYSSRFLAHGLCFLGELQIFLLCSVQGSAATRGCCFLPRLSKGSDSSCCVGLTKNVCYQALLPLLRGSPVLKKEFGLWVQTPTQPSTIWMTETSHSTSSSLSFLTCEMG